MTPGNSQRYVDHLFVRGVSEEIDPQRLPAALLQVRRTTGRSSLLGRDDLFSLGLRSQRSSDQSSTSLFGDVGICTSGLQTPGEETGSTMTHNLSSLEMSNVLAASAPGSQRDDKHSDSIEESTKPRNGFHNTVIDKSKSTTAALRPEDELVSTERPTTSPLMIFYNRYSPLRGLKDNYDSSSDGSGDEGSDSSSGSAVSHSPSPSLSIQAQKITSRRMRLKINATLELGA